MDMKGRRIASGLLFEHGAQLFSCPASRLTTNSCPGLCYVGSSVGIKPLPAKCEVMTSFTLIDPFRRLLPAAFSIRIPCRVQPYHKAAQTIVD